MSNRVCHFKLVLLGDTAVGKSCLVVRFVRDEFFEFQEPTIGGECAAVARLLVVHVLTFVLVLILRHLDYRHSPFANLRILLCTAFQLPS